MTALRDLGRSDGGDSYAWAPLLGRGWPAWPHLVNAAAAAYLQGRPKDALAIRKLRKDEKNDPPFLKEVNHG